MMKLVNIYSDQFILFAIFSVLSQIWIADKIHSFSILRTACMSNFEYEIAAVVIELTCFVC